MIKYMRNILVLLLICCTVISFCACNKEDDPFTDSVFDSIDTVTTDDDGNNKSIYALSADETYDKYGIISFDPQFNFDNYYDGDKYLYTFISSNGIITLGRYDYPSGTEFETVCKDPLCDHANSGCPFYGYGGYPALFNGRIYFTRKNAGTFEICEYVFETNKSTVVVTNCLRNINYLKYNGNLYISYTEQPDDITDIDRDKVVRQFVVVSPSGGVTRIGTLSEFSSEFGGIVYQDRYYIDFLPETENGSNKFSVLKRDIKSGTVEKITDITYSREVAKPDGFNSFMLYNDQLLFRARYASSVGGHKYQDTLDDVWLLDLKTGESKLICTPDSYTYDMANIWCLFSQQCFMWPEPRKSEDDHYVMHISFPLKGEEKTFDVSQAVFDATGETLPLGTFVNQMAYSALKVRITKEGSTYDSYIAYEVDLENGNVLKYPVE